MSSTNAPRYLPTLTEVVSPELFSQTVRAEQTQAVQAEPWADATQAAMGLDEIASITQNVLEKVTPLLEQKLRSSAQELFEVQISVVLPALHRHIEAAVQQAIQETLRDRDRQS